VSRPCQSECGRANASWAGPAIDVHHDGVLAEFQIGDLGVVSGVHRRAVRGHGMIQILLVDGLIGVEDETLFAAGTGLRAFANSPET